MSDMHSLLINRFKLTAFRPGQEQVIAALLAGRSALAVFPTGGGKSLCYQLPALLLPGLTLVVSPLIALMKDQVDALQALGIGAARLDSSLSKQQVQAIYAGIEQQQIKLLYVSPERLKNKRFVQRLAHWKMSLLAIDEAHCISEWGHNFRPDYLHLAALATRLQVERVLALTATATPAVAADICRQFAIAPLDHVQTSFARPNLQLSVMPTGEAERIALLLARLQQLPSAAATIVYVTLQKTAEDIAAAINRAGLCAAYYHAGLNDAEREQVQNQFMQGAVPIVVATIAFGMGIDKSNIRAVYHFNLPKSIENYVQEIGRAGRDGLPSVCEMLAVSDDIRVLENFTYGDTPSAESLQQLVQYLFSLGSEFAISSYELSQQFDLRPLVLNTALTYLELRGVLAAQSPFYREYKITFVQSEAFVLSQFDAARAAFLQRLFASAKRGRKWLTIDLQAAAAQLNEPKERLSAALEYLAEQEWIELAPAQLRQTYKRTADIIANDELVVLTTYLSELFVAREARDIQRLHGVLQLINNPKCLSVQLRHYFGEKDAEACGQCSHCRAGAQQQVPAQLHLPAAQPLTPSQRALIAELQTQAHPALHQPRQLARFLCGLPSPATTRSTLRTHSAYGSLSDVSFSVILENLQTPVVCT